MKKLAIILLVILSGCTNRPEVAGSSCAEKCKVIGAYKYKVNPNEFFYCECYVRLKGAEDE